MRNGTGARDSAREHVGQVRCARVDIGTYGIDRRDLGEVVEHSRVIDIAGVEDGVWGKFGESHPVAGWSSFGGTALSAWPMFHTEALLDRIPGRDRYDNSKGRQ